MCGVFSTHIGHHNLLCQREGRHWNAVFSCDPSALICPTLLSMLFADVRLEPHERIKIE